MTKKWIKKWMLVFSCTTGAAFSSLAQTTPWTLEQCLEYAKNNNISINQLRLDTRTAGQSLIQSRSALLPSVSGTVSQGVTHSNLTSSGSVGSSGSMGVTSSLTLFNGGYLKNDIRQQGLAVESAALNVAEAENDMSLQIVQAYLNIILDKEIVVYMEDLLATSKAQVNQMNDKFTIGTVARKDLIQLQAQLATDTYSLTNAQNNEKQDKITLKQLLQLPIETEFDVVKPDTTLVPGRLTSLGDAVASALQLRPEMKNSQLQISMADLALKKVKAGYLPTISLSGGVGTSYGSAYSEGLNQLGTNGYQQIGVTAAIPIFSRNTNKVNEAKARISIQQAELSLKNTQTLLTQSIERAYVNAQNAQASFESTKGQLSYNEEAFRIASAQLKVGSANTVEYIQQRNLYTQAIQSYTQAKYNSILYQKIYEFYRGEPLSLN